MFTPIAGLPAEIIGFTANGRVTREDRQAVLEPTIDMALKQHEQVRLLYVVGSDFAGYEPSALLDDAVFGTRHFRDFERIAFLAEDGPYRRAAGAMKGLIPADLKVMPIQSMESAKAWLTG
ncbi:STAS/SEC14 domain-containing protein [Bauldia sp.]|uniref:STAS/SEC14 domain-containing protein n=1 Tax=Bauldia sp. TaxID=2575872 RepID=UPI003BA95A72